MNWDAIGAIAELLGAIGVIASLVYLARQIRQSREQMSQNTRALRASGYQQYRSEIASAWSSALAAPGLTRGIHAGLMDYDQLDDETAFQFDCWFGPIIAAYDNAYYQYRTGMLDSDRWEIQHSDLQRTFALYPGLSQYWKTHRVGAGPEFVALVEEILGEEGEGADGGQR
jgi:hypothetical protein